MQSDGKTYWLDRKENVRKVYLAVWAACIILVALDPLVHKHASFGFDAWFGFHGWYGFVACVGLVLAAKALRRVLMRPEDYYDR